MAKNRCYQQIVMNIKPDLVRNDKMMGKDFTVVPMVMMVEGVLAGNCGPIMYPFKEMAVVPQIWNSKPVVVYHPEDNGVHGSACTPEELTVRAIGTIMNTKAVDGKLTAEAWLDPERIDLIDSRITEAIANKTTMELSTGLYMDVEDTPGKWNDVAYVGMASNFRPDHLAVLPDIEGACSIKDGAGFIRVNMKFKDIVIDNGLGHNDIRSQLSQLVRLSDSNDEYSYVEDVKDGHVIFERNDKLFKQPFTVESDGNTLKLVGESVEIVRVMTYELVKNEAKGNSMDKESKEKVVNEIISNESTRWTEEDRPTLLAMNDDALLKMVPNIEEEPVIDTTTIQNAAVKGAADIKPAVPTMLTVNEHIASLPKEIQEVLNHGLATYNEKRNALVATIVANKLNTFSEDFLKSKDIKELEALARFCTPVENVSVSADNRFDYSGQAPVVTNSDEEPLPLPSTVAK